MEREEKKPRTFLSALLAFSHASVYSIFLSISFTLNGIVFGTSFWLVCAAAAARKMCVCVSLLSKALPTNRQGHEIY